MSKYYSLIVSPKKSLTAEGYLICENVPLCRSGFQEYYGRELKGFQGYQDSWGLDADTKYPVYRPRESVLDPDFMRSLEGKTIVDEHPDGHVVTVENEGEVNCGHVQNVGQGEDLDNEVTLKGDLHIKDATLIDKVMPESDPNNEYGTAVRDVSVGYGLNLDRLDDGMIVMKKLRGNHVAVVEKGRAGPKFAIGDSAPPEIIKQREPIMSLRDLILGRGIKAVLPDATPEETEKIKKELDVSSKPALDAEPAEMHPAHKSLQACLDAMAKGDHTMAESHKKELMKHLGHSEEEKPESEEKLEELKETAKDEELEQKEETPAEEKEETHAADGGEHAEKQIDDPGESVLKAANDSAREFVKNVKPIVAGFVMIPKSKRTKDQQVMIDSYNSHVKKLNSGKSAYGLFTKVRLPGGIPSLVVATDSTPAALPCTCFDGVPHATGLRKHQNCPSLQKGTK
jgi:hypothetical protein